MESIDQHEEILLETQNSEPVLELNENDINIICIDSLCRLCANTGDRLIPIYSEEGTTNDLANKMNLYLPVKVCEADSLPLNCCWNCATTVLAWHELVVTSVEADRRLKSLLAETETHLLQPTSEVELKGDEDEQPSDSTAASLSAFCPDTQNVEPGKKKVRNSKKKNPQQATEFILKEDTWPKENCSTIDDDPLETYMDGIRNPFISDCDLIEEEENSLNQSVHVSEICEADGGDTADISADSKDAESLTSEYVKEGNNDEPKSVRTSKYNKSKLEIFEDVMEDEDEKVLSEWISKSTDDKSEVLSFTCECCNFVTVHEADLIQHMKETHSDVVMTLKRQKKKKSQSEMESLVKKQRRKNTKLDQEAVNSAKITVENRVYYRCHICGKNLHSPYTYIWHNRIHTGERPFVCDLCGKQFRVSQGLVRHLRETHQGVKNFPCDICGRMFATRRNVEEHRRIHTNERPYICDLCGKAFKQKASLFVHNRSHNDSFPYKCSYCDQGFRTRPPLLVHVTRHTGEKPYPCDVCGRCFRIKYELKRHRLIHSDEKPFSCLDCGISFRQKRYLRNHNKINHNRSTD